MDKTNVLQWFEVENTGYTLDEETGDCSWFQERRTKYETLRWDYFNSAMAFADKQQTRMDGSMKYRVVQVDFVRTERQTIETRTYTTVDEYLTIQFAGAIINT